MNIDKLTEIAFDDIGGGCAKIRTPGGTERNIGFQAVVPINPNLVMLILEKKARRGSQRLPQLAEVADDLVAFRIANNFQPAEEIQLL